VAWWNDYDRGDYGRWSTRFDSADWNHPEGRSFGFGAAGSGGGYGYGPRSRYDTGYAPRVAPPQSPSYGRRADRLVRRGAYDAGYAVQPRGGWGMEAGYHDVGQGSWTRGGGSGRGSGRGSGSEYGGHGGYGRGGYSAGAYGSRGYGTGGYGGSWIGYDRGYRW
jgi:hypothetical protein